MFSSSGPVARGCVPAAPGAACLLQAHHKRVRPRFRSAPGEGLSTILTDSRLSCQIGASKLRNSVREGLGWVEPSQTDLPDITEPPPSDFRGVPCLCFTRRARRPKAPQQAPRRAARGQNGFAGTFQSARFRWVRPLGLAQVFVPSGVQCRLAASLWLSSTSSAGPRGFRMQSHQGCSLMLALAH